MTKGSHIFNEQYYLIELPISAGIRISDFKLGLGPVMEFNLDMDSDMAQLDEYSNQMRSMDFSFQAIAGYKVGILHIDIKYINKFSSITDGFALGNDILKYNKSANRIMFGLGVTF